MCMNHIKYFGLLFLAAASMFASCNPPTEVAPKEDGVVLTADRKEITADGVDKAVFTVTYQDKDVTGEAQIVNVESGETVANAEFTTSAPATYKFKATYDGKESPEITVTALAVSGLVLTPDKESIISNGNDKVVFTVTYDGNDVTKSATIVNINEGKPWAEGVNEFSSITSGIYEFKAGYDGKVSNIVKITVAPAPLNALVLQSNTPRIAANGTDKAVFTVLYEGKDVTSEAKIKNVTDDEYLDSNQFSYSGSLKTVDFVAEYEGMTSDQINIGFGDFYKNVLLVRFSGTWCGPCTTLGSALSQALASHPDRLTQITVHVDDQYTSENYYSFENYFPGNSVPRMYFDFEKPGTLTVVSAQEIIAKITEHEKNAAECGISVRSTIVNKQAKVTVSVTARTAGAYNLGVVLVEDGLVGPQSGVTSYVHDNTLRRLATTIGGASLGDLAVNQQIVKEFTIDMKGYTDNCRIVAYVNTYDGENYSTTNSVSAPVSGFTDYRFEE